MVRAKKSTTSKKIAAKRAGNRTKTSTKKRLSPKASTATKKAAEALWGVGIPPHTLLQEVHELLLLRCLDEAAGNYAAAAEIFGPSRQSVQQYANSSLRDARWTKFQQNKRKKG